MLAVVLAVPPTEPPSEGAQAVDPGSKLAGLPLALRTVLTLQKEGLRRVLLVVPAERPAVAQAIRADSRLNAELRCLELDRGESPWAALSRAVDEPFLLARYDRVVDPAIYRALLVARLDERHGLVASSAGRPAGPLVGTPELLDRLSSSSSSDPLAGLTAEPSVDLVEVPDAWSADAGTAAGRKQAVFHLFEACRKPVDGVVARRLNRHVSIFLSKRLVDTPITPNQTTVATFGVGLLAAAAAMQGGYGWTLLGAALMQLNSILDGVDGELARVRFQQSKLGQWLDTIGDDASNAIFYAALAMGARSLPHGELLSAAGWVAAAAAVLAAAVYYRELVRLGSGDLYAVEWDFDRRTPAGLWGKVVLGFRYLLKQDSFIFAFLCAALLGVLSYALPLLALGGVITLVAAVGRSLGLWGARSA